MAQRPGKQRKLRSACSPTFVYSHLLCRRFRLKVILLGSLQCLGIHQILELDRFHSWNSFSRYCHRRLRFHLRLLNVLLMSRSPLTRMAIRLRTVLIVPLRIVMAPRMDIFFAVLSVLCELCFVFLFYYHLIGPCLLRPASRSRRLLRARPAVVFSWFDHSCARLSVPESAICA